MKTAAVEAEGVEAETAAAKEATAEAEAETAAVAACKANKRHMNAICRH